MKTLLIVKNRAIGDSLFVLSVISYLQKNLPYLKIIYAVPKWIYPLYAQIQLSNVKFVPLNWKIVFLNFDCIFEFHQRSSSKKLLQIISLIRFVPYYFHNHHIKHSTCILDQGKIKPAIQRDLDGIWSILAKKFHYGLVYPSYKDYPPRFFNQVTNNERKKGSILNVFLGISASRKAKIWPFSYYRELIHLLNQENEKFKVHLFLTNSKLDQEIKDLVINMQVEIHQTSLNELVSQMNMMDVYVGSDSGPKHLCVALDIPTFTLFGPEEPIEWHPYENEKHIFYFKDSLFCRGEGKQHYCGLSQCEKMDCLKEWTPKLMKEQLNYFYLLRTWDRSGKFNILAS